MSIWCSSKLEADTVTAVVMRELELLALAADGALTGLGRTLADGADSEQLLAVATALLPLQDKAAVLADHLVVVAGVPTPDLTAVLEDLCDLERSDAHTQSWRITPTSVRRYFDTHPNADPTKAGARLEAVSSTPIPQTVTYLITDTANRHGHITVSQALAVLDLHSEALATELAHRRELRHLGLSQVGPTVLLAEADQEDVLKALRDAGYAPSGRREQLAAQLAPVRGGGEAYEAPPQLRAGARSRRRTTRRGSPRCPPMRSRARSRWPARSASSPRTWVRRTARRLPPRSTPAAGCTSSTAPETAGTPRSP
ncbi:helicase-associated domain-containing protein [Streptomyces sp. NPDC059003]|uniref:helicase-associated domain-containing protein n=1 Tax=Streptomyces sp. NPDC059003 TaxID=3346691 RepID=UPI0036B6F980